jgi:hypothetical protein
MTDDNNITAGLDQADEDILSTTVFDEALEAAAGTEGGTGFPYRFLFQSFSSPLLRINSP